MVKACQEMLAALTDLGVCAAKVVKDGKVSIADLSVLMSLVADQADFAAAIADVGQIPAEVKDLSDDDAKALLDSVLKMIHAIKGA